MLLFLTAGRLARRNQWIRGGYDDRALKSESEKRVNRLSVRGKGEKISSKREPVHRLNRKQKIAQGVTFAVHKLSTLGGSSRKRSGRGLLQHFSAFHQQKIC